MLNGNSLNIVARGPSLPIHINQAQPTATRLREPAGKADPIWDTEFAPKFATPVKPRLLQPMGTAPTLEGLGRFFDRVAEISAIARTQHLELPTLREELAANGISTVPDDEAIEWETLGARHMPAQESDIEPTWRDPETTAALARRIEWEKYTFACGPVTTARLTTKDGALAIQQVGVRTPDPQFLRQMLQRFVQAYDVLPTTEELDDMRAAARYYDNKPVLAAMPDDLFAAWKSRDKSLDLLYGEDRDPFRDQLTDVEADDFEGVPALGIDGVESQPCWDCGLVDGHAGFDGEPMTQGLLDTVPTACQAQTIALIYGEDA